MSEGICEVEGVLQEWCPLTQLLQQIPQKAQRGLFTYDLNLTCIDVLPDYIAAGTNSGLVYWYNRQTGSLQRLRCENTNTSIKCVKIVSTVDYMVAAGTEQGIVTAFQIPKASPDSVPDILKPKNKEIERYTISGLHASPVTAIEWSQNGMKLFSGDRNGVVVLTEFDFYMHLSKSTELLNEQFEIVQLNYCQQLLAISTVFRSIIAQQADKWKVTQVGTKERKTLGRFGATFCKFNHGVVLYASRPGLRLWLCDKAGLVQQTLIFKDAITQPRSKIQLVNPANKIDSFDRSFGKALQFGENMLVVFNPDVLYVVHPGSISVVALLDCARKILDVAVTKDEIFILEGERNILRIGYGPETFQNEVIASTSNDVSSSPSLLNEITNKIKNKAKGSLQRISSELVFEKKTVPPPNDEISPTAVGDEAMELPPIVDLPVGSLPSIDTSKTELTVEVDVHNTPVKVDPGRQEILDKISSQQFDEVVFRKGKRKHDKKKRSTAIFQGQGAESESDTISTASSDQMGASTDEQSESSVSQTQSSFSFLKDIPTLLKTRQQAVERDFKHNDELSRRMAELGDVDPYKSPEEKSQASIDTCESASENLLLTPDAFKQEQEKTFARLAALELEQDKTENMSISMNMTPSSSVSSKISENMQVSEMESETTKSEDRSPVTDDSQYDDLPLPKQLCFYKSSYATDLLEEKDKIAKDLKLPVDILPDMRSQDTILKDIRLKEKMFSQVLNVNLVDNEDEGEDSSSSSNDNCDISNFVKDAEVFITNELLTKLTTPEPSPSHQPAVKAGASSLQRSSDFTESANDIHEACFTKHVDELANTQLDFYEDEKPECEQGLTNESIKSKTSSMMSYLSYGPPSNSSAVPSIDYTNVATVNVSDPSDRWIEFKSPEPVASLSVCDNYVVSCDISNNVYFSALSGLGLKWIQLDYKASFVHMSPDGRVVWILDRHRKTAHALLSQKNGPYSDTVEEAALNVRSFTVDADECWYVTHDGRVKRQGQLVRVPCGRIEDIQCPWLVVCVSCNKGMVLGITSDDELICKPPNTEYFKLVKTPSSPVTAIAVGPGTIGWIVDDKSNIYFSDDLEAKEPCWWQILISEYIFQNTPTPFQTLHHKIKLGNMRPNLQLKNTSIAACDTSVWIYDRMISTLHVNKTDFNGYMWRQIKSSLPKVKWFALSGEGVFEEKGHLWLLSADGDLFCSKPDSHHFQSVAAPGSEPPSCIASCTDTLWVLTSDGILYTRLGLTEHNVCGNSWRELNLPEVCTFRLVWLSCGCDVVWGCDDMGQIHMTVGSPHDMATNIFQPAWIEVDGGPLNGNKFEKVFVGPHLHMVWAIDNKKNIYVREAIFPDFPVGTGWVYVAGIEAVHLTISSTCVWALAPSGNVYRRFGITQNNYIGDYWKRIPGTFDLLTSSVDDTLWAFDKEEQLVKLEVKNVIINATQGKPELVVGEGDDWEVVQ